MTPLRFKTVQNHCVPWPLPASRCIAIASRPKANPLRAFAARLEAPPSLALAFLCAATLYFSIPLLYRALLHSALPNCTLPLPSIANLCISVAFPGASRRLISMPSHRVSLLLNTSPSLCKTSPSGSVAAPRQSPLFHCVAEIRIAPRSLCCSSGSKTELSLSYAVLGRAALHLSVATPCATSLFLCCAPPGTADLRRCFTRRPYQPAFSSGKKFASCIM